MEEFQKDRDSPAHWGSSEESENTCGTEGFNLERQEIIDEISSKPSLNDPTERSAKRRKPALMFKSNAVGESSTRASPTQGVEMAQKLQKDRDSPAHGVSLLSEGTKAASGTEGLSIEIQEIIDDGSETPVNDPIDQVESLQKKDDEASTERSRKSCETGVKVVKKEDGAAASTHVEDDLVVIEAQNESGGEKLKEKDDEASTERSAKSCETGLKVVKKEGGAEASTHVDDDLVVIEAQNESGGEKLKKDDEASTERSAKSCETGLKVVKKEDGAEASTHVDDDLVVIEARNEPGGEKLKEKDDEVSTERSAKSCETGLKVVKDEDGAEASTHVDDDLVVIGAQNESGGEKLEENSQTELSSQLRVDLKETMLGFVYRRQFGKRR